MTLQELKEWINSLPEAFDEYEVVNGAESELDEQYYCRKDNPIISAMVDEESHEICLFSDGTLELTDEDIEVINKLKKENYENQKN